MQVPHTGGWFIVKKQAQPPLISSFVSSLGVTFFCYFAETRNKAPPPPILHCRWLIPPDLIQFSIVGIADGSGFWNRKMNIGLLDMHFAFFFFLIILHEKMRSVSIL